jgi:hypothetical protein
MSSFQTTQRLLLDAAQIIEQTGINMHPVHALHRANGTSIQRSVAWSHLCDVCGMDYMDFSADEIIDSLVAAAFIEPEEIKS